jgi:predicted nucleic acid-binding protein
VTVLYWDASALVKRYAAEPGTPVVNAAHPGAGPGPKGSAVLQSRCPTPFLSPVRLTEAISDRSLQLLRRYRLSHGLLIADAVIAATALTLDMPLVTKNQRDYRFIEDLRLLPYPRPFPG